MTERDEQRTRAQLTHHVDQLTGLASEIRADRESRGEPAPVLPWTLAMLRAMQARPRSARVRVAIQFLLRRTRRMFAPGGGGQP